jgi:hypothetical protein
MAMGTYQNKQCSEIEIWSDSVDSHYTVLPESCRLTANDGDSSDDGKIVFWVNGQNVYESGNYGNGVRFAIGEGCQG